MDLIAQTERCYLRNIIPEDVQDMFELDSDPEVMKYLVHKPVSRIEETKAIIERVLWQYKEFGMGRWAVIHKETGEWMGWTGMKYETQPFHGKEPYHDLGYRFKKKFWGQGYGYETAVEGLRWGVEELKVPVINAFAHINNAGSNRILQKLGFEKIDKIFAHDSWNNWYQFRNSHIPSI